MSSDESRIEYLAGGPAAAGDLDAADLDANDLARLDGVRALLADAALWDEPARGLGERIVASLSAPAVPAVASRRRGRWLVPFAAGAAAAAAVATVIAVATHDDGEHYPVAATATMTPGAAAPAGTEVGSVAMRVTASGLRIDLVAPGLPGLFDGSVYECWVHTAAGGQSCGTFHTGGGDIVLWSGVRDPALVDSIGVTLEPAGDTDPGPSGVQVLGGPVVVAPKD